MKTFYIPTSTMNFNNILSSESISPKAFYTQREYGYSRWVEVPENPFDNVIILYDRLCFFKRPQCGVEDHPLLVEVQLDETGLKQYKDCFYCDHTIYLTPSLTRFIFFTETDQRVTLSMSENSLETKMLPLYIERMVVKGAVSGKYSLIKSDKEPCELNKLEIERDIRINKMKGLLYGYYIGAFLSTDEEKVMYLNVLKEIYDIFVTVWSSDKKVLSQYQNNRLDELFLKLNCENEDYRDLLSLVGNEKIVKEILSRPYINLRGWIDKTYYLRQLLQPNDGDENPAIKWIESKICSAKEQMSKNYKCLTPDEEQIVVLEGKLLTIKAIENETGRELCKAWVNETLASGTNGNINSYQNDLADKITLRAKDIMQKEWENSIVKTYLNDLRHHIRGAAFNQKWNNGLLSSIAAVIVAGDDWNNLLAFMQSKGMYDYRLAFAFYGELNGFANLTRDFTDLLYGLLYGQDGRYVWNVYKEFHGQLHGESLSVPKNEDVPMPQEKSEEPKGTTYNDIPLDLKPIFECDDFQKLPTKAREYYRVEAIKVFQSNPGDLLKQLEDLAGGCSVSKTKTAWKNCVKHIKSNTKKSSKKQVENLSLFAGNPDVFPIGDSFYCDQNIWSHIEPLVENAQKKELKKEIDWIQKVYKDGGYKKKDGSWIECTNHSNENVICHFYNTAKKKLDTKLLDSVVNRLKELYNVK